MKRRPLVGIALCVAVGTWLGLSQGQSGIVLVATLILFVSAVVLHVMHRGRLSLAALLVSILLMSWGGAAKVEERSIASLLTDQGNTLESRVEIYGRIISDMVDIPNDSGGGRVRFRLQARSVAIDGLHYPVNDVLKVTLYGIPRYPPVYGERWDLEGTLYPLRSRSHNQRTRYGLKVGLRNAQRTTLTQSHFMAWCFGARRRASELLSVGMEAYPDVTGVVNALVLGYRANLPDAIRQSFMHTGTMHVFAISGLHVGILCTVLVFVIGVLRIPRPLWVLALAPLVISYACVTGARASAIRASVMAIAYLMAPLMHRRADAVTAFAFAAVVILIWQPEQLLDMGFLYSFVVVAGIMAIVPIFDRLIDSWLALDPFLPPDSPAPWWQGIAKLVMRTVSVSVAAWLTSAPLSLLFFGRFSPVALIGNVLAVPLAFLILVTGCLSIGIGSVAGWAGEIFNHANWCFVRFLVAGMQAIERVPYGWTECDHIPLFMVVIWYAVLISGVVLLRRRQKTEIVGRKSEA